MGIISTIIHQMILNQKTSTNELNIEQSMMFIEKGEEHIIKWYTFLFKYTLSRDKDIDNTVKVHVILTDYKSI